MPDPSMYAESIAAFLDRIKGRRLLIQTHDVPDPDALASAEAFRVIAKSRGINARIVTNGFPSRRENRALITECRITLTSLSRVIIKKPERHAWAYIDCLPGGGNVTLHSAAPGDVYFAVDHHAVARRGSFRGDGTIIADTDAGATATIMAKVLVSMGIALTPRLASALSYAIITDTMDFSRGNTPVDLESFAALFPHTNQRIISRLRNASKSRSYFRSVHTSLGNTMSFRQVSWVNVGAVESGEIVAEMADFILSCERITWALALGYRGEKLFLSLRSANPRARCGRIIRRITAGHPRAVGGHDQFAGGVVTLEKPSKAQQTADEIINEYLRRVLRIPRSEPVPAGTRLIDQ